MLNRDVLERRFGHTSLRAGQREVIERVLAGVNTLAVLPTGGGKSLCYQFPALVLEGLCVVVSPLIALMRDQVEALVARGIPAVRLDSSTGDEGVWEGIERGEVKLLYVSPERFTEPGVMAVLKRQRVSMVAVDEAHCISEWGHSFRASYIRLPRLVRRLKPGVVLALTATASPKVAQGIRKAFGILKRDQVQTSFYRDNLTFNVTVCSTEEKKERLLEVLNAEGRLPAIVYVTRRGDAEVVAAFLAENGVAARAYHAGMPADARAQVQDGFLEHRFPVICATIAFGMGVDMPAVRSVVHYHPPKSPEGWIQESGRAGRDGRPSHCEVLVNGDDRAVLEGMVMARQPGEDAVRAVLQNVFSQGGRAVVSRYNLSTLGDVPVELLDILLARLEAGGWIVPDGGSWMWCRVVPLRWGLEARKRVLDGFGKKDVEVLQEVLESRQRVNLLELANHRVVKLNKLITLLRELEAGGEVKLELSHSLTHYRIKKEPASLTELVGEVTGVFQYHTAHNLERMEAVFKMAVSGKCVAGALVGYFGEKLTEPCGKCVSCAGKERPRLLPVSRVSGVTLEELERVQQLVAERRAALSGPARLARFLCGVHSPAMMRYRLYQHRDWGMLGRLSYDEVLAIAEAQHI